MGETGIIATLNPTAQEFNPTNHIPLTIAVGVPYPYPPYAVTPPPHLSPIPTRSILLSPVPPTPESILRKDLGAFGEVRAVNTDSFRHGIITAHFYDLRHAETAFTAIRTHHVHCVSFFNPLSHHQFYSAPPPPPGLVAGVPLWAHYVHADAENQGTLVLFNVDDNVSANHLRRVFEPFGIHYLLFIYLFFNIFNYFIIIFCLLFVSEVRSESRVFFNRKNKKLVLGPVSITFFLCVSTLTPFFYFYFL
jgi:hypothetical protein